VDTLSMPMSWPVSFRAKPIMR